MARQMTPSEALEQAARLAKSGNTDEAKRLFSRVLDADPANKKAKKALKSLRGAKGAALTPVDFERVSKLLNAGKLDAALADINKLCRLHPEQPALHNLRGVILSRRKDTAHAVEAYKTALTLEPRFSEALNNLATSLTGLGQFKEALGCFQELLNRGDADAEVYLNLAKALKGAGQKENAVEALRRALKLNQLYPDALSDLGNLYNDLGQHDEAVRCYERALGIDARHGNSMLNLARTLASMKHHAPAVKLYEQLLEKNPEDEHSLNGIANALLAMNRTDEASKYFERLLKMRPDDSVARHLLSAITGQQITRGDAAYARALFDGYAANFEQHLTEELGYSLPEKIPALLEQLDGENAWYSRTLDLGCGTGLVGLQIRSYCEHLIGADVSQAMLDKAEEKAVYDELLLGDVGALLDDMAAGTAPFDLILCADVLVYIGALDMLFRQIAAQSCPGTRILISTEKLEGEDFRLQPSGRFAHSAAYVLKNAEAAGLALLLQQTVPWRKERGEWLPGELFVFTPAETSAAAP